jgi:hypothetical protein
MKRMKNGRSFHMVVKINGEYFRAPVYKGKKIYDEEEEDE